MLYSGGKDSTLLLHLVREVRTDVPCIWFRTGEPDRYVKQTIVELDLTVISYAPADVFILSDGAQYSIVHDYRFGTHLFPLLVDVSTGTECSLQHCPQRTPTMELPYDLLLWGAKDSDTHWVTNGIALKEDGLMAGNARLVAPLRHMTDDQVRGNMVALKIPYTPVADELPLCTLCMTPGVDQVYCPELKAFIPTHQWERDTALTAFRNRLQ